MLLLMRSNRLTLSVRWNAVLTFPMMEATMVGASKSGRTIDVVVLAAARLAVKRPKYFAAILPLCSMPVIEIRDLTKKKKSQAEKGFPPVSNQI